MADGGTVARWVARRLEHGHVTRAGMSRISVLAAVGAAVWFSRGDMAGGLAGSAFLGTVLFCDAVRERMRAHRRDALTLWLAAMLSQLREYVVYLGLTAGAVLTGISGAWGWAAGALVALALRDSLLLAGSAPAAPGTGQSARSPLSSSQRRTGGFLDGLAPRPPQGSRDSDPGLTARLFGAAAVDGTGVSDATGAGEPGGKSGGPRGAGGVGTTPVAYSAPSATEAPTPLRRLAAFPQPVRFAAIAVAATLGDARVAFVTLIVGCVVAATAHLVDPTGARR
ncbi:hypothetical protein [Nocardiopsis halotolerans]|uniref:hypothetical protein n=1 Tax=Nocardiopsis halotolerans TaxID=124252 RepID=UPI0003776496|nr:hypothetical protein [Nocardiopsis halotolerans]